MRNQCHSQRYENLNVIEEIALTVDEYLLHYVDVTSSHEFSIVKSFSSGVNLILRNRGITKSNWVSRHRLFLAFAPIVMSDDGPNEYISQLKMCFHSYSSSENKSRSPIK